MNYLVDTHYLIWSLIDPKKMAPSHREVLLDPTATKYVSKVSFWEVAIRYNRGKLHLRGVSPEDFLPAARDAGYESYDITAEDLLSSHRLPKNKTHRDPFDRLLVWQCIRNKLVFISADNEVGQYSKYGLRLAKTC